MNAVSIAACVIAAASLFSGPVWAGQVPGPSAAADIPISHRDRVYAAEQFSNTVSVIDPASDTMLGVIRLGDPSPANFSALYKGQLLVHGLGFSPDHRTLAVVSVGSNSVTFIDTATNAIKHTTYLGRSPHEAFFTPDGQELWVTVRGQDYVAVINTRTFLEKERIPTPAGPGMQIFSPDGKLAYVCSSFSPETLVFDTRTKRQVGRVPQPSPFCPNIAASPDGTQVWMTLKDIGKTVVFAARPPFAVLATLDTGPITNHVNFASNARGTFAYVTVGGLNVVKVFRPSDFAQVAIIPVGKMPHGVWPSGDGSRIYVGLENDDAMVSIDTLTDTVVARVPIGQAPQAVVYVPGAVPSGPGTKGLEPLGIAASAAHVELLAVGPLSDTAQRPTSVALFDQGLLQVLEASVTQLPPGKHFVLALADDPTGQGVIEPIASFVTNRAGSAIVNAVGPIRQLLEWSGADHRRFLVIAPQGADGPGAPVQIQAP